MTATVLTGLAVFAAGAAVLLRLQPPLGSVFTDVPEGHRQAEAIAFMRDNGIVTGYEDGSYRPSTPVNRAEFAQVVMGAVDAAAEAKACAATFHGTYGADALFFLDVPAGAWYEPAVCFGVAEEAIGGYGDRTFRPENKITVAEASKVLTGVFDLVLPEGLETDPWYRRHIDALAERRALPSEITAFDQPLDRALLAEMLYLLLQPAHQHPVSTYDDVLVRSRLLKQGPVRLGVDLPTAEFLEVLNPIRLEAGLQALRPNGLLEQAAVGHADDMVANSFYSHEGSDGRTMEDRIRDTGYFDVDASTCACTGWEYFYAEAVLRGTETVADTVRALLASDVHRSILLSEDFTEIGVGRVEDAWTLDFGHIRYQR